MQQAPEFIYKVVTNEALSEVAEGNSFIGMPVDLDDGYIHFSTAEQLAETLRRHFAGQSDLRLLAVKTSTVAQVLRWEPSRGGALFPHLYGPLPLSAVVWSEEISVSKDGNVDLPEAVQ
ncbi:hypothetical protein GCM10007989_29280 [Devosia pacifica]|uniref:Dihydroorotate dehydrogenase n=1 Tax=Devosia pacifica TaxID=1335967 RepID=A0A918VUW6_9HYPH|nr:DUF952 domain-containing protein [Devosia pacifica]GHA31390.1 hypothetical protein GCM10007989_29280 [Devosia pacifica]